MTTQSRIRKAAAALVALTVVLSVIGPVGTAAAQEVTVSQSTTDTTAAPGETVTLQTTISVTDANAPGLDIQLPSSWMGNMTDADGGAPKPKTGEANVLQVVWLSSGTYTVTYEVYVPSDASAGDYSVDVEASAIDPATDDRMVETTSTTISVEEPEQNQEPTADAGSDQTVNEGASVSLDATGSSDPDGDALSYSWTQTDGPSITLSDASTATPTFTAPEVQSDTTLTFEVTASDGEAVDTDTVSVTVQDVPEPNQNPSASFDYSPSSPTAGDQVAFDASDSSDSDGSIESYAWDFDGDGQTDATSETASHTFSSPGDYDVTLTVTDDDGATSNTTQTVSVGEQPNQNPTASFTVDPAQPEEGQTATFDASASDDPDGTIASYAWDFDDDGQTDATGETVTHAYDSSGTYTATLTVTDDDGATATTQQEVVVSAPPENLDPTASFTYAPSNPTTADQVTFDASASSDSDGSIAGYQWEFGDGTTATGATPAHTYDSSGTYTVALTVTDDDGATSTETMDVTVEESETSEVVFAVNAGGAEYTATDGTVFQADTNFDGGNDYGISSDTDIANTENDPLYRTERWGDFSYDIPVEDGEYEVTLYFAEIYQGVSSDDVIDGAGPDDGTNENDAVFDTSIEGQEVISNYDLFAELGPLNATQRTFTATVTDGELNVEFDADIDYAKISAIKVESTTGGANTPPTVDAGDDQTVTEGDAVQLSASGSDADGDALSYSWTQTGGPSVTLSDASTATPTFTAPAVQSDTTLTFEVTASDGNGGSATDTVSVTVQNTGESDLSTAVSLTPTEATAGPDGEATYDVVVEDVDGGVGAYTMTVSIGDTATAHIADVEPAHANGETTDVSIAADGDSATVEAALVDTEQTGSVTLFTVTVASDTGGETPVDLSVGALGTEAGESYDVTATNGATFVDSSLVVGSSDQPAQDPDGDGQYEDVNGDGSVDVLDVQLLFAERNSAVVTSNVDAFDFNGDGTVDILDVQALYHEEVA